MNRQARILASAAALAAAMSAWSST